MEISELSSKLLGEWVYFLERETECCPTCKIHRKIGTWAIYSGKVTSIELTEDNILLCFCDETCSVETFDIPLCDVFLEEEDAEREMVNRNEKA